MLAYLLLGTGQLLGLLIIPFGWPGLWLQLASLVLFGWATTFEPFGAVPLVLLTGLAVVAELFEAVITGGRVQRSRRRRIAMGGIVGGIFGAAVGYAFPLVGSLFGALVGSILGTLVTTVTPWSSKTGREALGGQVIGMGVKSAAAVVVAVFTLLTLMR